MVAHSHPHRTAPPKAPYFEDVRRSFKMVRKSPTVNVFVSKMCRARWIKLMLLGGTDVMCSTESRDGLVRLRARTMMTGSWLS